MDIANLLISLISGGAGGNIVGAVFKDKSLGALGNTIAGLVGGAAGGYILQGVGFLNSMGLGDTTLGSLAGNVGASGVSGMIITFVVGLIKKAMTKA